MLQGIILFLIFGKYNSHRANNMNNYRDLEIYKLAFDLASRVLIYSQSSCDEAFSQLEMLIVLYPDMIEFSLLSKEYEILGRKINTYIDYVDNNWRT